jgi:hypothetical protein
MKTLGNSEDRREIAARIALVRADAPARWGKMSAPQMICHLSDAFRAALGEKEASPATGFFQRTVMKFGALWIPIPWPHGVPTRPELAQDMGGTRPVEFATDRAELLALYGRFCAAGEQLTRTPHAIFGPMSVEDWLRWGYLHTDHHLRQCGVSR